MGGICSTNGDEEYIIGYLCETQKEGTTRKNKT
jgi:hypothetical protein